MGYQEMREMPNALKPAILVLAFLQIIFMASPGLRGFGWFALLTTILEFLVALGVFVAFFFDLTFVQSAQYPLIELVYSGIFTILSALSTIYYFVNIFYKFNFWFLLATVVSVFLVILYGLQSLISWTARGGQGGVSSRNNQATATMPPPMPGGGASFPAGVNPA